jgi:cbb3-type cytochrome oxidase maturation protein
MAVIYLLLPLALIVSLAAVVAFIWAARSGQFDDVATPQLRVLFDDDAPKSSESDAEGPTEQRDQS